MDRSSDRLIGPWKRSDVRSLATVCNEAQKLYEPITVGLLATAPSQYPDIAAARKALIAQPIYRWLKREMQDVLKRAPHSPPIAEFRFVCLLVQFMTIAIAEASRPAIGHVRTDKKLVAASNAIDRVERLIDDGTVFLAQRKLDMLRQLLAESRSELRKPRQKAARSPALQGLAIAMQREFAIADAQLIAVVAAVTGLTCSERTAERYIAAATRAYKP